MNGFLWLGVICTAILLVAILLDGFDDAFDAMDLGPSWLSLPVLAAVGGAFGFTAGATRDALGRPAAIAIGLASGLVFGAATVKFSSIFMDTPQSTDTEGDMVGSLGRIVEAPTENRYGAALLTRPYGVIKVACAADGPIAVGTEVVVVHVASSTLVTVIPFDPTPNLNP